MSNAVAAFWLAWFSLPVVLEPGVHAVQNRSFVFPIHMETADRKTCESLLLLVSEDRGKNWRIHNKLSARASRLIFEAPHDGLYWFALQIVFKNGKVVPSEAENFTPSQKVYVNTAHRLVLRSRNTGGQPLTQASFEESSLPNLQREVENLRTAVEGLRKRIAELEKERKPN